MLTGRRRIGKDNLLTWGNFLSCICGVLKMISVLQRCLSEITSSSIMLWVKSSQRRNSPRINGFQRENTGRERKGSGRRQMRFGERKRITLSLYPSGSLSSISLSISFVPPRRLLWLILFSLSIHLPRVQALIYDCMPCSSLSEIAWICMSHCAIIRAWPQLSVTWTLQTQHSVVFHLTCFQMIFGAGVQAAARNWNKPIKTAIYLVNPSFVHFLNSSSCSRWSFRCSLSNSKHRRPKQTKVKLFLILQYSKCE